MSEYNIQAVVEGDYDCVPQKATQGSAGYDVCCSKDLLLYQAGYYTIHTGLSLAIPEGLCALLLPRSSLHTYGLKLVNSVGLIDSDYRGEILLKVEFDGYNFVSPGVPVRLKKGTRLAQLLFIETPNTMISIVESLGATVRGAGGFGSTGGYHSDNEVF